MKISYFHILIVAFICGCSGINTYDEPGGLVIYDAGPGGVPDGAIRPNRPVMTGEIAPVYGFVSKEAMVEYYYLGEVDLLGGKVAANPIYFFYDEDGNPLFRISDDQSKIVGWHPVVNVIPTRTGYTPLWRIHKVRVKGKSNQAAINALAKLPSIKDTCQMDAACPIGQKCIEERCTDPINVGIFELNSIKSLDTLNNSKLLIFQTDQVINCPVVDADAKLLKGISNPDKAFPKMQIWFQRLKAFCVLMEGTKSLFGVGQEALSLEQITTINPAYFIRRELDFGTDEIQYVLPARNLVLTEYLPGSSHYSPMVREVSVIVSKDHEFKDIRSVAEAKNNGLKMISTNNVHNLVVRGTVPACQSDDDCAKTGGKVDPPLKCSIEQGYCSPPFSRYGEECRRGVKECDPKAGAGGSRLACVGLRVRDKYFCFNSCDSTSKDENPDPDIDTRCGSVPKLLCYTLRQTDPTRPNGVCIQKCNSRAGGKEELLAQCVSPTCGDGKLDFGETCDDSNKINGDGCNEFCSLSTFDRCDGISDCRGQGQECKEPVEGQDMTYCLPPLNPEKDESEEEGKYRTTCMEYDYCWPPDERADWLGKKDEEVMP